MMQRLRPTVMIIMALFSLTACAGKVGHKGKRVAKLERVKPKVGFGKNQATTKQLDSSSLASKVNAGNEQDKLPLKTESAVNLLNHYYLNPDHTMRVDIANHGYSRFSISGERITDVFVYPQESITLKIHDQGYLIVVPDKDKLEKTGWARIYLTFTGEQGTTQDIYLRFRKGNPSPITFIQSPTTK